MLYNKLPGLVAELSSISGIALHPGRLDELGLHLRRIAAWVPVAHALVITVGVLSVGRAKTTRHQLSKYKETAKKKGYGVIPIQFQGAFPKEIAFDRQRTEREYLEGIAKT